MRPPCPGLWLLSCLLVATTSRATQTYPALSTEVEVSGFGVFRCDAGFTIAPMWLGDGPLDLESATVRWLVRCPGAPQEIPGALSFSLEMSEVEARAFFAASRAASPPFGFSLAYLMTPPRGVGDRVPADLWGEATATLNAGASALHVTGTASLRDRNLWPPSAPTLVTFETRGDMRFECYRRVDAQTSASDDYCARAIDRLGLRGRYTIATPDTDEGCAAATDGIPLTLALGVLAGFAVRARRRPPSALASQAHGLRTRAAPYHRRPIAAASRSARAARHAAPRPRP